MKKLKYLLIFILSLGIFNSCLIDDETDLDLNDDGLNIASFDKTKINFVALANGDEYDMEIQMKVVGPTLSDLTNDITVTVAAATTSTAVSGDHYIIETPSIVLAADNNFLGIVEVTMITAGNSPPMDGTPEYDEYVAPVFDLDIVSATGDPMVTASGRSAEVTLNYTPPNPYAGDYAVEMRYFHPTAGGSYPPSVNPDDPYGGVRNYEKTLTAITGRKCETGFAVWGDTDVCWITCNADNSITFEVDDTWTYDVALGDPDDPANVPYYDPATGVIYMYYHYYGTGGARIFWEIFTPLF